MGFPFLAGFYSKDIILEIAYSKYSFIGIFSYWLGTVSAFFTAFYSFRLFFITFLLDSNIYRNIFNKVHESSLIMILPLFLLSLFSLFIGFFLRDLFIGLGTHFWSNSIFYLNSNVSLFIESEFLPSSIKMIPIIFSMLDCFYL